MPTPGRPVFLARRAYRRRRLTDAARLLPVVGLFLFLVPIFWHPADTPARDTAPGGLYLFGVWALLVLAAGVVAGRLARAAEDEEGPEDRGAGGPGGAG